MPQTNSEKRGYFWHHMLYPDPSVHIGVARKEDIETTVPAELRLEHGHGAKWGQHVPVEKREVAARSEQNVEDTRILWEERDREEGEGGDRHVLLLNQLLHGSIGVHVVRMSRNDVLVKGEDLRLRHRC